MFSIQFAGAQVNGEQNATIEPITDSGVEFLTWKGLKDQNDKYGMSKTDGAPMFKHRQLGRDRQHAEVSPHTAQHVRVNTKVYFNA